MRRSFSYLLAGAAAVLAVSCSDSIQPPVAATGSIALASKGGTPPGLTTSFTLTSAGGTYYMGNPGLGLWKLTVPAGAVTSSIDASAAVVNRGGRIYVVVSQVNGEHINFAHPAILETTIDASTLRQARGASSLNVLAILYSTSVGGALNADQPTHLDLGTGRLWREVTHFSGYSVHSGRWVDCEANPSDPECPLPGEVIAN